MFAKLLTLLLAVLPVAMRSVLLVGLLGLLACGSGFVAVFSGGKSDPPPPAPPPSFAAKTGQFAPLVPELGYVLEVTTKNFELPATLSRIKVELRADGLVVDQVPGRLQDPTKVECFYDTNPFIARIRSQYGIEGVHKHDVQAELAVLVDGVEIAAPVPILLLRGPTASLISNTQTQLLSPLGQSVLARVKFIKLQTPDPARFEPGSAAWIEELIDINELAVKIAFGNDLNTQFPIAVKTVSLDTNGDLMARFTMPAHTLPEQVHFVVHSIMSGTSTIVSNLFYRPAIFSASPATGASEGGSIVSLFGQALVPQNGTTGKLDFSRLNLKVRKGGRQTDIPLNRIRAGSTSRRLEFTMPASPDGRPGEADILLGVTVDAIKYRNSKVLVGSEANGVFTYGDGFSYFGPRGAQLRDVPVLVRFAPFVGSARLAGDALSLVSRADGIPFVTTLTSRGNGLFTRFGQPVRAGDVADPDQRNPVDMCVADFVGDQTRSGVIINRGTRNSLARYSGFVGATNTNPPVRFDKNLLPIPFEPGLRCAHGDLNADRIDDLAVIPDKTSLNTVPQLFLSDGSIKVGSPRFNKQDFSDYKGPFGFTAVEIADQDGDGKLDLIFAQGGLAPRVLIAYGNGSNRFPQEDVVDLKLKLDFQTAGYTPDANSEVVGLHAAGLAGDKTIVLVLSGVSGSTVSPPAFVFLTGGKQVRTFVALKSDNFIKFPGGARIFKTSTAGDIDGDDFVEVAVGAGNDLFQPIRVFDDDSSSGFAQVPNAISGLSLMLNIRSLTIGFAVEPGKHRHAEGRRALFVTHDSLTSTAVELRVSTFLRDPDSTEVRLLSPNAWRQIDDEIHGVVLGRFRPASLLAADEALDAYLAVDGGLIPLDNDALGELTASSKLPVTQLMPGTLTRVQAGHIKNSPLDELPAFLTSDGRIGVVLPNGTRTVVYLRNGGADLDLRTFAPVKLRNRALQVTSGIASGDVNADGHPDLVVLLGLSTGPNLGESDEALLLVLPGDPNTGSGDFPFGSPLAVATTHGNAQSLVVGDFATTLTDNYLEFAAAVPVGAPKGTADGNHVRFFRLDLDSSKNEWAILESPASGGLPVGNQPAQLVASDYNSDGRTDIAVASRADDKLWIYYNFSPPGSAEVNLKEFQGAPANPIALPAGETREMIGGDLNGDKIPDLVVVVESGTITLQQHVAYFLTPGAVSVPQLPLVPDSRTGNFVFSSGSWNIRNGRMSAGVGDLNGDGTPDLVLGWNTSGPRDFNLRALFGNNF